MTRHELLTGSKAPLTEWEYKRWMVWLTQRAEQAKEAKT